jgi:hypothetical protein
MSIPLQRKYSKAKAAGNHVVWTGNQVLPVPFTMSGLVTTDSFAFLRIQGQAVIATGFNAHFRVPSGDRDLQLSIVLADANNDIASQTRLYLNGVTFGGDKAFTPAVKMPVGSLWKVNVELICGDPEFLPQDLTVTYHLRYANGPVRTNFWASGEPNVGIGFYDINGNFVIQ